MYKKLWWQNERRLTDWFDPSTPEGVPLPPYRNEREREVYMQNYPSDGIILMQSKNGLSKPTGNVGQPAKNNRRFFGCQCWILCKTLKLLLFFNQLNN